MTDHISDLLTEFDCVIVPDLGGFIMRYESAQVLPDRVIPPRKVVSFNSQLTHNDGLFASRYAQKYGIKYKKALAEVSGFVDNLLIKLDSGEKVNIGKVGSLYQNSSDLLEFRADEAFDMPDNFGLGILRIAPRVHRVLQASSSQITITLPRRTNVFRYAAACAVLFLFTFLLPEQLDDASMRNYSTINPVDWNEVLFQQEQERERARLDSIQQAEEQQLLLELQRELAMQQDYKYHVVVAALDKESAEKYCTELLDNHHLGARVIPYKNYHRVSIESFPNRTEALKAMRDLRRSSDEYSRAWVYCE